MIIRLRNIDSVYAVRTQSTLWRYFSSRDVAVHTPWPRVVHLYLLYIEWSNGQLGWADGQLGRSFIARGALHSVWLALPEMLTDEHSCA